MIVSWSHLVVRWYLGGRWSYLDLAIRWPRLFFRWYLVTGWYRLDLVVGWYHWDLVVGSKWYFTALMSIP